MFNQLFQRETVVRQHLAAPLAGSRRHYLEHCAGRGLAQSTLRSIAKHLLGAARFWPAEGTGTIARPQIEAMAAQWVAERPGRRSAAAGLALAQCTTSWLRFAGRLETPAPPAVPHANRLADFATSLRQERGLSAHTVAAYVACVSAFLQRHCSAERSLAEVTITDLDRRLADLAARGLVRMTIQFHAKALRAFFRYGEAVGWARPGLAAAIPMPRIYSGETVVVGPVWEDVQRLLGAAEGDRPGELRARAILLLLAVYGLRSGEVRVLRLEDLDWEAETLRVRRPKTGRTQVYPLARTVGDAILRYLREARPPCACREVFLTFRKPPQPLSRAAVWQLVGSRMRRLGIDVRPCGPHALRHACAQRLLDTGFSMKAIGDCLGHRDPASTAVYARVDLARLRQVADLDLEGLA